LDAALKSMTKEGEKLKLQRVVDPSILGGLQVQIADRFVDLSIQSRVNKMHKTLLGL
jgi:F0F1-type ATP synthase delta subunit